MPPGNQDALLAVIRRDALTAHEVAGVVDLLQRAPRASSSSTSSTAARGLAAGQRRCLPSRDPRLSARGNEVWKRLSLVLELLARMERWLRLEMRERVSRLTYVASRAQRG